MQVCASGRQSLGALGDAALSLEPRVAAGVPAGPAVGVRVGVLAGPYGSKSPADLLAFMRICVHYLARGAWLDEGVLLRETHRLAGIPGC